MGRRTLGREWGRRGGVAGPFGTSHSAISIVSREVPVGVAKRVTSDTSVAPGDVRRPTIN